MDKELAMWVIYHGYHAAPVPLLAATLHRQCYSASASRLGVAKLSFLDDTLFLDHSDFDKWRPKLSKKSFGVVTPLGSDRYGNRVFVLGRRHFLSILERTIHASMTLGGNQEKILLVDTAGCTNAKIELGVWMQHLAGRSYPSICRLGEMLIRQGTRQALSKVANLVQSFEKELC